MHLESIKHKSMQTITGTVLDQCGLLLFLHRDTCTLCVCVCVCVCVCLCVWISAEWHYQSLCKGSAPCRWQLRPPYLTLETIPQAGSGAPWEAEQTFSFPCCWPWSGDTTQVTVSCGPSLPLSPSTISLFKLGVRGVFQIPLGNEVQKWGCQI